MIFKVIVFIAAMGLAFPAFGDEGSLSGEKRDKWSYVLGVELGNAIKTRSTDVNLDMVREGIKDVLSGAKLRFTDKEMAEIKTAVEEEISATKEKRVKALSERNKKAEEKFLSENKGKEGVVSLPSGLQYKVLKNGTGPVPKEDDVVSVHYRVTFPDGKEIGNSYDKNEPGTFALDNVIPGWKEGVSKMKVGSKWQFYIPSRLAYGEDGVGELVGPNALLVFDLELLKIMDRQDGKPDATSAEGKMEGKQPEGK